MLHLKECRRCHDCNFIVQCYLLMMIGVKLSIFVLDTFYIINE